MCQHRTPPTWVTSATNAKDGVPDPDGRIAFGVARIQEPQGQIVSPLLVMDADGSDMIQVIDCDVSRPRFSPDGTHLAFGIVVSDGSWQIATTAVDGSDLRILTNGPGNAQTPDWSPDGSWLVYARSEHKAVVDAGGTETLWRMHADGSDQRPIGKPDSSDWEPRISPDGLEVLFTRADPADGFRYTPMIRTLATGQERVAKVDTRDLEHPDWSRAGRFIVYKPSPNGAIERVPADDPAATPELLPVASIRKPPPARARARRPRCSTWTAASAAVCMQSLSWDWRETSQGRRGAISSPRIAWPGRSGS